MAESAHQRAGSAAEQAVLRLARGRGWRCIARNFHSRRGEIDLVLQDAGLLIVVEVRYRAGNAFGGGLDSVDKRKQARIIHATRLFLATHPEWAETPLRFDVVAVDGAGKVDWVEDAFYAE